MGHVYVILIGMYTCYLVLNQKNNPIGTRTQFLNEFIIILDVSYVLVGFKQKWRETFGDKAHED